MEDLDVAGEALIRPGHEDLPGDLEVSHGRGPDDHRLPAISQARPLHLREGLAPHLQEKRILGSMMGSNRFRLDMPTYVNFYLDGRLKLDEMISRRIELPDVNDAIDAMKKGEVARSVITFDS